MDSNAFTGIIDESHQHSANNNLDIDSPLISLISQEDIEHRIKQRLELKYLIESIAEVFYTHQVLPYDIIITDEEGWVLLLKESGKDYDRIILPGICFADDAIGANGIGLALKYKKPIKVIGTQHYNMDLKNHISFGVPLTYNQKIIGAAGFVVPINNNELEIKVMESTLNAINAMAHNMLNTRKTVHELLITKQFINGAYSSQAVIAVDENIKIIQANKNAQAIIGALTEETAYQPLSNYIPDADKLIFREADSPKSLITSSGHKISNFISTPVTDASEHPVGWIIEFELPVVDKPHKRSVLFTFDDIIGKSEEMKKLLSIARIVAGSSASVLITGESGTGKELLAQAIHSSSSAHKGAFVALNCSAIPSELIESELFGYIEGAFTGARKGGMQGKFVKADNGTLFLDEIGDMPLEMQPKILRVIQEQQVVPVGSTSSIMVNVRIIAATNQNLEKMIKEGLFRSDLYYRINVVELLIPALRHRKEDIYPLVNYFIEKHSEQLGKNVSFISEQAIELLNRYDWPGNIRELENVIQYAITMAIGNQINIEHLPDKIYSSDLSANEQEKSSPGQDEPPWITAEKKHLLKIVVKNQGNISKAAREFGVSRATFYRKLQDYQLLDEIKLIRKK